MKTNVMFCFKVGEGAAALQALVYASNTTYPEYMDELVGMADAAGAPFHALAVLNLCNEIRQTTSFDAIHGESGWELHDHFDWHRCWEIGSRLV